MRDLIDYPEYIPTGEVSNFEKITVANDWGVLKFFYGNHPVSNIKEIVVVEDGKPAKHFRCYKKAFTTWISDHGHRYDVTQKDYVIEQPVISGLITVEIRLSTLLASADKNRKKFMVSAYRESVEL